MADYSTPFPDDQVVSFDFQKLHNLIFPADVRSGEQVRAQVRSRGPGCDIDGELRVWRISPLGIELLLPDETRPPPKGCAMDLRLQMGTQTTFFEGLVVDLIRKEHNRTLLGIRLNRLEQPRDDDVERRENSRWICSEQFAPSAVATNPARFNDFLYFKVHDISTQGLRLLASLRNKFIVPGMRLDLQTSFPMVAELTLPVLVEHVAVQTIANKEMLALGVSFEGLNKRHRRIIGQYLMQFGQDVNPRQLSAAGFLADNVASAVDYSFVRTEDEYRQVLELRLDANRIAGRIPDGMKPEDMADIYDARSRIVVGKYRDKVVATARLSFSQINDKLEQEDYVRWTSDMPRRDEVVELGRLCTHPDYRGGDLLAGLFKFMGVTCVQASRRYVVIFSNDKMLPLYGRMGFADTGLEFEHKLYPGMRQHLMIGDVYKAMLGASVGPMYWNVVWSDVTDYVMDFSMLAPGPVDNVRLAFYRSMRPLTKALRHFAKRPRRTKPTS